jgi:hypothetical protein
MLPLATKRRREIPKRGNDEMMLGITITNKRERDIHSSQLRDTVWHTPQLIRAT